MGIVSQDSHDRRDVQNRRTLATQLKGLFVLLLLLLWWWGPHRVLRYPQQSGQGLDVIISMLH